MPKAQGFTICSLGGLPVVSTPGEIDLTDAELLLHVLLVATANAVVVVVDMTATTYCDASTIDTLEWINQWLNDNNGELRVIPATPAPPVMKATHADQPFPIFASLPDALTMPPHGQINPDNLTHPIATRPHCGQGTTYPCCHVTPGAPWCQRAREYERALKCHQADKTMIAMSCQHDNIDYTSVYATRLQRTAYEHHLNYKAA